METAAEIICPWCGETCTLVIDTGQGSHCLVSDCEVCCRSFEVRVECDPGEILGLEVLAG